MHHQLTLNLKPQTLNPSPPDDLAAASAAPPARCITESIPHAAHHAPIRPRPPGGRGGCDGRRGGGEFEGPADVHARGLGAAHFCGVWGDDDDDA